MKNIILVGFMGTGKSSAGRLVAERTGMQFIDMDEEVAVREGMTVPEIFSSRGEPAFRELERALVKELSQRQGLVISTGGGIVLNPDNIRDFSASGTVICLKAEPEEILKRVGHDTNRPLLQGGDRLARISELLARRKPLYESIPLQVDTAGQRPADTAEAVIRICIPGTT